MALELKQTVGLSQQLVITPQLQQAIKLLQLGRLELLEAVQKELLENPVLEELPGEQGSDTDSMSDRPEESRPEVGESEQSLSEVRDAQDSTVRDTSSAEWEQYIGTYPSSASGMRGSGDELPTYENTLTRKEDLQEHLLWQLRLSALARDREEIGIELIGNINDDGYLRAELPEIAEKGGWPVSTVEEVLKKIQAMDPLGVGARDLTECLLLQITHYYQAGTDRQALTDMVVDHLKLLEKRDYATIAKLMKLPLRRVGQLVKMISELEPKPGRPYGGETTQYITPDVYVYKIGVDYVVVLNDEGLPRLQVSHFYKNLLSNSKTGVARNEQTREYVQDKLRSAIWLIKSIHQRQRTLYKVTKCIAKFQREFLDKGVDYLKPMILKDVADEIGVHESTVSRATSNKYVHTHQGIFELKYFFNSGVPANDGADAIAAESVKNKLKQIISAENTKHPYSDQEIVEFLKQSNINIARRTVAKYREMLGILPSSRRKQVF